VAMRADRRRWSFGRPVSSIWCSLLTLAIVLPTGVGRCALHNSELVFQGPSEHRHLVGAIHAGLNCTVSTGFTTLLGNQNVCSGWNGVRNSFNRPSHGYGPLRDALCRESTYARRPYRADCHSQVAGGTDFAISFAWKSFAYEQSNDAATKERVLKAARERAFVLVLLTVGGASHHLTKVQGHSFNMFKGFEDTHRFPQEWFTQYVNETMSLFKMWSKDDVPDNVCVVWKPNNIAERHPSLNVTFHHPSASNGVQHYMDRFTTSLAHLHGIKVADLTDITLRERPAGYTADYEGDVMHGYDDARLATALLQRACAVCPKQCPKWDCNGLLPDVALEVNDPGLIAIKVVRDKPAGAADTDAHELDDSQSSQLLSKLAPLAT